MCWWVTKLIQHLKLDVGWGTSPCAAHTPVGARKCFTWQQPRIRYVFICFYFCFIFLIFSVQSRIATTITSVRVARCGDRFVSPKSHSFTNRCVSVTPTATVTTHYMLLWMNHHSPFHTNAHHFQNFHKKDTFKFRTNKWIKTRLPKWPRSRPLLTWYADNKISMKEDQ